MRYEAGGVSEPVWMLLKGKPLLMRGINNRFLDHSDHSPITRLTKLIVTAIQYVLGIFPENK